MYSKGQARSRSDDSDLLVSRPISLEEKAVEGKQIDIAVETTLSDRCKIYNSGDKLDVDR